MLKNKQIIINVMYFVLYHVYRFIGMTGGYTIGATGLEPITTVCETAVLTLNYTPTPP